MGAKRLTQEEFIKRAKEIHGDKYDYSKAIFDNVDEKVCLVCKEHGEFWQSPYKHINRKQGCPYCSRNVKFTKEKFIEECLKTHSIKYDYSEVEYINAQKNVKIICPEHGAFWQKANYHRRGGNCPLCVGGIKDTTETFIEKAKKIHGNNYDYSRVVYKNSIEKVEIGCPKHGYFFVKPNNHLGELKGGCPKCKESNGEKRVRGWLEKNGFELNKDFFQEYRFEDCKDKYTLPFDFYIPSKKILIEFQGKQHYGAYKKFGGEKSFEKLKKHDKIKKEYCKNNEYFLLEIPYFKIKELNKILEEQVGTNKN